MEDKKLSHINKKGQPAMVNVGDKMVTKRVAKAQCLVVPPKEILDHMKDNEIFTAKGPVFQTAIIAGTMAAKRTSDLIPMCHPLPIESCNIEITVENDVIKISGEVSTTGRTGVEMEALTAVNVAALTVYDMCKALGHGMSIKECKLLSKTGGKQDYYAT